MLALATLGIINTGLAYWPFYLPVDQAGAATASVITYVMPVVALFLGVGLLGEHLTTGAIAGLLLIGLGAWLATSRPAPGTIAARPSSPNPDSRPRSSSSYGGLCPRDGYQGHFPGQPCCQPGRG
jgi:EamA-like transporter family